METLERRRQTYVKDIRHATAPRVTQPLPAESKGTTSPDLERLFFRWWSNSCHMHTFLEGMIFPIIEAGREDIFNATRFGQTLVDAYRCSRKDFMKHHVSSCFRDFFFGVTTTDTGSIMRGKGAGVGAHEDTQCPLILPMQVVFEGMRVDASTINFVRVEEVCMVVAPQYKCEGCHKMVSVKTSKSKHHGVWTVK